MTQSALAEVNKIYTVAKKEKNDAQMIKALLFRMNLQQAKEENAGQKNIWELEKEINSASEPARSVLASIAAESYWNYFQQHRWQMYNRTETINFKKEDIASWGVTDFHNKISAFYLESLKNEKLLQQAKLEPFDAIIVKGNTRHLRPTLFDLLAHRALNYFKNDERNLNKPAYAFEINDPAAFAKASIFASYGFVTRDTLSLHFKALQLYQRLIEFHLKDSSLDALIDADIDRIEFVQAYSVNADKEELYRASLENITGRYQNLPAAAQAWYLIARIHAEKAKLYNPSENEANRFEYLTAKTVCSTVLTGNGSPSTEGIVNCQNLLNEILQKELNFQTEKVNIPGEPFRVLVSYRNFTQLHFRIIKMDKGLKERLGDNDWNDEYWKNYYEYRRLRILTSPFPIQKIIRNTPQK